MTGKNINNLCFILFLAAVPYSAAQDTPVAPQSAPAAAPAPAPLRPPELKLENLSLDQAIAEVSRDQEALPALYNAVMEIYLRQGKRDKAISLLDTYYRNRGRDNSILTSLANFYEQAGDPDKAAGVLEKLLSIDSENATDTKLALSDIHLRHGNFDKALELIEPLLKRDPENLVLLRKAALVQRGRKDWPAAEAMVRKIIALQPHNWDYQQLSELHERQKQNDKALEVLEEGIKKLPDEEVPLAITISNLHVRNGEKEKALKRLNDILWKVNDPSLKANIRSMIKNIESQSAQPVIPPVPATNAPPAAK